LRIIANFGRPANTVSHIYGRRDPKPGDVVVEIDLKEFIADLIITPTGRMPAAGR
jgi:hypothetical protein